MVINLENVIGGGQQRLSGGATLSTAAGKRQSAIGPYIISRFVEDAMILQQGFCFVVIYLLASISAQIFRKADDAEEINQKMPITITPAMISETCEGAAHLDHVAQPLEEPAFQRDDRAPRTSHGVFRRRKSWLGEGMRTFKKILRLPARSLRHINEGWLVEVCRIRIQERCGTKQPVK
jgi:hypothetical protein